MDYPFSKELQTAAGEFSNGNFGLWFYKLVPLDASNNCKPCTPNAGDKNVTAFYREIYDRLKVNPALKKLLEKKHADQQDFCRVHSQNGGGAIEIRAQLLTPLITGIGKTHPGEVGVTIDHCMGIPYLPASGVKGLARLAHILNLIEDKEKAAFLIEGDELNDTHVESLIPELFGGDLAVGDGFHKLRGNVVFLDAYPDEIPDLHVDIMNPHYGDYYSDDEHRTPPADHLEPVPVQFLTVQKGTTFVFRAVVNNAEDLQEIVVNAFDRALGREGFGAKTAVGYGRFARCEKPTRQKGAPVSSEIIKEASPSERATAPEPVRETWVKPVLTWTPGTGEVTARFEEKIAVAKGKAIVPEKYHAKLFGKKKSAVPESVRAEAIGNSWKIVEIN